MSDPLVSVFTPSHDPKFLDDACESMLAQTYENWQWVVMLNNGAEWKPLTEDHRIEIYYHRKPIASVGRAKQLACLPCRGEILVELDHDDLLHPYALERVIDAFIDNPDLGMVYSHTIQIQEDGSPDLQTFNQNNGWEYVTCKLQEEYYIYASAMPPTPHNISYIWFAPNHLRAFTKTAYEAVGGYDDTKDILDDQDLMCRLYQYGDFHLINEPLYMQRVHAKNTQSQEDINARIQMETVWLSDRHIEANALAWAKRNDLLALDLGAAHSRPKGYLGVDQYDGPDVDLIATLPGPLNLPDNSCGVIRAFDFLEHVVDKVSMINEIYRLLAPGGMLLSSTPSTDGRGAFQDPTHVAYYNENSFWYYTNPDYRNFVPELKASFQVSRIFTDFPSDWHRQHNILYVMANLIAIKPNTPRNGGELLW